MGRIPQEDLDAIRDRVPIAELIGEHVALKPAGSSLKGLCPFHQEKTPSFTVNTTTHTWRCFGCGENGDAVSFIQQIEGEGFRWAVKYLSDRYSVPVHYDADTEDDGASSKTRLIEVHEIAARAYAHSLLTDPDAQPARDNLTERGFDISEAVERFGCGYAPAQRSLSALLERKGYTADEIVEAGLAVRRGNDTIKDRFQDRLTWTIRNSFGKPIGFGARKLRENDPVTSKFINTIETPLYKKSKVLYALDIARKEIARTRQAIVVEGYTDVMAMHLAGKTNAVAACGTAFGTEHLNTLRRLVGDSGEIIFAFDGDDAGQKAAQSTYRDFNKHLRRLSALRNDEDLDPDEIRQKHGDAALAALVDNRIPLSEATILGVIARMPRETTEDRVAALDAALPYINDITDGIIRSEYASKVARALKFSPSQVESRISPTGQASEAPPVRTPAEDTTRGDWAEKELLQVFAQHQQLAATHVPDWDIDSKFTHSASFAVLDILRRALATPNETQRPWPLHIHDCCATDGDANLIANLTASALPVTLDQAPEYTQELLRQLDRQVYRRTIEELRSKIANSPTSEDRSSALKQLIAYQRTHAEDGGIR